jgi:hypothetical protein
MALFSRILCGTAVAAALAAGQARADEPVPAVSTLSDAPVLVIGGGARVPTLDDPSGTEESFLTDLRRTLSEVSLSIGATPVVADSVTEVEPGYTAYAQIDIAGFTIGGHIAGWTDADAAGEVNRSFGVGASYSLESWTVGIDWSRGNYDEVFLDVGETGDVIAFTSSYALRPGLSISGLLEYSGDEPESGGGGDEGAFAVGIGTLISF